MEQGRCLSLGLKVLGCKNPGLHRTKDKEFGRIGENGEELGFRVSVLCQWLEKFGLLMITGVNRR